MTLQFEPASAGPDDLQAARRREQLLRNELARVRTAALAWRNGLAALLAGLIGFGLIKGRSDVSTLSERWAAAVGVLLLASLAVGALAALSLMRAAHGLPSVTSAAQLPSETVSEHLEALASARALRRGIALTGVCVAFLVTAVAVTWYGPVR